MCHAENPLWIQKIVLFLLCCYENRIWKHSTSINERCFGFSCKNFKNSKPLLKMYGKSLKNYLYWKSALHFTKFEESGTVEWLFNWESESFRLESHWCTWRDFGTQLHYEALCHLLIKLDNELRETSGFFCLGFFVLY